jgi:hypothetical protein
MELRASPAQLLLSELLALPAVDLERRVDAALDTNAALVSAASLTGPG